MLPDSFGNLKSQTNAAADCLFGYTGRAFDKNTELQINGERIYSAQLGDWMSKDPIVLYGGDTNTSRYCGNSPTNATDPSGLAVYLVNRPLNLGGPPKQGKAAPKFNIATHTFVYTTKPGTNERLHTYSWGNEFGDTQNHWWEDRRTDVKAAADDIRRKAGMPEPHSPKNLKDVLDAALARASERGTKVYGDDYNQAVADAFTLLQNDPTSGIIDRGSGHIHMGLIGNCKSEARKLLSLAQKVKDLGVEGARQFLATHVWIEYGWLPKLKLPGQ